ncbi:RagB/SusD family nutrient uptake outer membrane protein [Butyricimonas paravirosa]|uniref:RagB/SusD family nutrient uptake outer membrane protein n=1 Tax=Butyricimonas paravirosa TaxID=1472417 RepID=UPI00210AB555|nr:RagB/SusD family nutrient uptake outer membrane protein [Butyricimonas paravirosa]MCQ4873308.1 RagB/SusD family nutrient uptake outer membrane protein [Butyricimonas paravirosa]
MSTRINTCRLIIWISFLSLGTMSCSGWLDVEPKAEIKGDVLFETEQGFEDAITGVYILMTDTRLYGKEMSFGFIEAVAQQYEIDPLTNSYFDCTQYRYDMDGVLTRIDGIWSAAYNVIANVNNILKNLETSSCVTPPVYARIKGECLGLRAFLHFDLLRLFGWGDLKARPEMLKKLSIPYVTDYNKEVTKQSTVEEVLKYIHADLEEADKLLPRVVAASRLTFNYYALLATRARVALWQGNRVAALQYAEDLISMEKEFPWVDKNRLETNDLQLRDFTFSSEYLFGLNVYQFSKITESSFEAKVDITRTNPQFLFHAAQTGKDLFELGDNTGAGDYRYLWLYDKLGTQYAFLKLKQVDKSTYANRLPLIRKAEIYYMAAECLNETGNNTDRQKAINYLNVVREKRGIQRKLSNDLDQSAVQREILKEWHKEMLLEGQMFFYYKRRGMLNIQGSTVIMNDKTYVMPLPKTEVEFGGRETY